MQRFKVCSRIVCQRATIFRGELIIWKERFYIDQMKLRLNYLPNHLYCIKEVWVNNHSTGNIPVTICRNDANVGKANSIQ